MCSEPLQYADFTGFQSPWICNHSTLNVIGNGRRAWNEKRPLPKKYAILFLFARGPALVTPALALYDIQSLQFGHILYDTFDGLSEPFSKAFEPT